MEKQVDNTQEQRIERMTKEVKLAQISAAFWKHEYSATITPDEALQAMQEYADLRCKPLVEALEKIIIMNADIESKQLEVLAINRTATKALQDYKK